MKLTTANLFLFPLLTLSLFAQDRQRVEIGDGTKIPFGTAIYSTEAEIVNSRVKNASLKFSTGGVGCDKNHSFRINDSADGFFTSSEYKSTVYLYTDCDTASNKSIQGIIGIFMEKTEAHYAYQYTADVKVSKVGDLNGDGLDELAIFSHEKTQSGYRTAVRLVEFSNGGLKKYGGFELQGEDDILTASKLYAEKADPPVFYRTIFKTDGSRWRPSQPFQPIGLDDDWTAYVTDRSQKGILKHLWAWTFILQMIGFVWLLGFVVYEVIVSARATEVEKTEKENRKAGTAAPIVRDDLPKLKPLTCENCGAGVPLRKGEMVCPHCGTKASTPEEYFNVAKVRGEINDKIRSAAAYLQRATFLGSNWARFATLFAAAWLSAALVAVIALFNTGNLEPYQTYLAYKAIFALGSFSSCFWVVSLLFGFAIWSTKVKKALPVVELKENLGRAETANCAQCGGAIEYRPNDLASVCGYCGVETYRANLAWNLRSLTNKANEKANFSLVEARKSVEDAVWEITGTPRVFAFLLILVAIFGGLVWLFSASYDNLPSSVKDGFDLIGDNTGAI